MSTIASINIAMETFALVISLIMFVGLFLSNTYSTQLNRLFIITLSINIVILLCDMLNWFLDGSPHSYATPILLWTNFCIIILCLPASAIYTDYLVTYISTKANISQRIVVVTYVFYGIFIVITAIAQSNNMVFYIDEKNHLCRNSLFWIPYFMPVVTFVVTTVLLIIYRKRLSIRDSIAFSSYIVLPVIAIVIQLKFFGITSIYVVITLAWLIIYVRIQTEQSKLLAQKELELANSRIDIMLSQIQPHFLYNSLNTIENLCMKDGWQAAEMVRNFSVYLRENMDSLTQKELVPFERELSHVKTYLEIEKKRFGKRLQVSYDLETIDFAVPTLTVQPIVENAVCHGVLEKPGGGTVTISTRLLQNGVKIIVSDDGVGYQAKETAESHEKAQDERSHVGLENVKSRLMAQCGGLLTVESRIGEGTVVMMTIPDVRRINK